MNVSLRGLWPFLLVPRPWIATHHGWYSSTANKRAILPRLKKSLAHFASANIAVSHAVADHLGIPCYVIPNPYDQAVFKRMHDVERDREILFVGRLVSDKAPHLAVEAVSHLICGGKPVKLTIVGSGPEEQHLRDLVRTLRLDDHVTFSAPLTGVSLARAMNRHRVLVVTSTVPEGFGLVALEAVACGCAVVAARVGGLPEAVGPCGLTFSPNDALDLADRVTQAIQGPVAADISSNYLATHRPAIVAAHYLRVIAGATR